MTEASLPLQSCSVALSLPAPPWEPVSPLLCFRKWSLRENASPCLPLLWSWQNGLRFPLPALSMNEQGAHQCFHFSGPGLIWKSWLAPSLSQGSLGPWVPVDGPTAWEEFSWYWENFHLGMMDHPVLLDTGHCVFFVQQLREVTWSADFFFSPERATSSTYLHVRHESFLAGCWAVISWGSRFLGLVVS